MNYFEMKWRLSACRIQAGYSQAEVAEILGCSDKTIVSWETGKTAPKMEKAQELSDLYGIPLAFLGFQISCLATVPTLLIEYRLFNRYLYFFLMGECIIPFLFCLP